MGGEHRGNEELEGQFVTLERVLTEHESIDSRYTVLTSRISKIKAALIWFEDWLDSGKGKLEVIEGELGWERRRIGVLMDKYSECDECLNKPEDYLATRWQQEECQDPNNL